MKKLLLLVIVVFAIFIFVCRQRVFLRDPFANVTRDGVKETGVQVFINYTNDVLIENDTQPAYVTIVQHGQHIGTPAELKCVHWMACLTDANVATLIAPMDAQVDGMSGKLVEFRDRAGHDVHVALR